MKLDDTAFSVPSIPSMDLEKSLRLWRDGLGFEVRPFAYQENRLTGCMLSNGHLMFMLNIRAGTPEKPRDYEGIRLYWAPENRCTVESAALRPLPTSL